MPTWIIVSLVIIVVWGIGSFFDSDRKMKAELKDLLSKSPSRSPQDYYERFFADSGVPQKVVSKIREIFNEQTGIDLKALEPDDDLSGDYSLIWALDSMADVEIVIALEEEFGIEISDGEAVAMKSLRSIAETVASKLALKKQANKTELSTASRSAVRFLDNLNH